MNTRLLLALAALAIPPASFACSAKEAAVKHCAAIDDPDRRLACFDAASGHSKAPEPVHATPQEAEDREAFGLEHRVRPRMNVISAVVVKARKNPYGKLVLTLDNGQVWKQTDDRKLRVAGETPRVVIRRGLLGSFSLKLEGSSTMIWVERVR